MQAASIIYLFSFSVIEVSTNKVATIVAEDSHMGTDQLKPNLTNTPTTTEINVSTTTENYHIGTMLYELFPELNRKISKYDFSKIVQLCLNRSKTQDTLSLKMNSVSENPIVIDKVDQKTHPATTDIIQRRVNQETRYSSNINYVARSAISGSKEYSITYPKSKLIPTFRNLGKRESPFRNKAKYAVRIYSNNSMELIQLEPNKTYINESLYLIPDFENLVSFGQELMLINLIPTIDEFNNTQFEQALAYAAVVPVSYEGFDPVNPVSKLKLLQANIKRQLNSDNLVLKKFSQKYLEALNFAVTVKSSSKRSVPQTKIINLTDSLLTSLDRRSIPAKLMTDLDTLYRYLLDDLKNEDLSNFHSNAKTKGSFIKQLFDYLSSSTFVQDNIKKLITIFRPYIKNEEKLSS